MTAPATESPRYRWKVLVSVVFGVFMIVLDATVVNIAFRALQLDLHADVDASQWVISIYVLFLGVSTPASGYLGGRYGLKRVSCWASPCSPWRRCCAASPRTCRP